jgi:putative transposase
MREYPFVDGQVYHVFSRSIAGFKIFNTETDYSRILQVIRYYKKEKPDVSFSRFDKLIHELKISFANEHNKKEELVSIIAYCVMPTHLHLILKQEKNNGISIFMNNILNSYTRYFNTKHERKGPLWESRFKSVPVMTDEYLLHLTRYLHLNPVTSQLIDSPEQWPASSYKEYLGIAENHDSFCKFSNVIKMKSDQYKEFVEDRISYQQELHRIKSLLLG